MSALPEKAEPEIARPGAARRAWDSDLAYSFRRSKVAVVAGTVTFIYMFAALFAPWIAPHDPYDMASVSIMDAFLPPAWIEGGDIRFLLGTDNVGRGVLSTIIHGSRISLGVGFASVILAATLGVSLGLISGYAGGRLDAFLMRIAEIQLSFPDILIALLIDGIIRSILGPPTQPSLGTLIRVGNDFLFSGEWWITIFPGIALAIMGLSVNLLGDWLRDALNPKLR